MCCAREVFPIPACPVRTAPLNRSFRKAASSEAISSSRPTSGQLPCTPNIAPHYMVQADTASRPSPNRLNGVVSLHRRFPLASPSPPRRAHALVDNDTPGNRIWHGKFTKTFDLCRKRTFGSSKKGPTLGWGWPSLRGRPTSAPVFWGLIGQMWSGILLSLTGDCDSILYAISRQSGTSAER